MELKDYWQTIRRRWRTVIVCFLLALLAAGLLTARMTPQYASTAQLFVSTSPSDTTDAYQGNLFASQRVTSYADMVSSRKLATMVNDALGGDYEPEALAGKVEATVLPETVLLEITATDPDPEIARDIAQSYAQALSERVTDLETPDGEDTALIKASIVDDARVNDTPVSPNWLRNMGLAAVLGLLLGLGIAVLRELLDTSVKSAEDVNAVTPTPVVGHLLSDPVAAAEPPTKVLDTQSPWSESFRVLRTNMQFVQVDSTTKTFVITSSLPGEGKTTTAINLAVTMAMAKQKVVLVECDLRRPQVADRLELEPAVGTTNVLIDQIALDEALQSYGDTGLQVLASGPIPPNPSELLQTQAMAELLRALRARFDVVLLDAPPLLPVTDAALLAAQADGAVVVLRHGTTTRDQLNHSLERLEHVDAKPLGVVINRAPVKKRGSYGYGYGYSYGYSYNAPGAAGSTTASGTAAKAKGRKTKQRGKRSKRADRAPDASNA